MSKSELNWKFPRTFWYANLIELFERAAYYGMFIALTLFLTREVGFTDIETGWVTAFFASFLYPERQYDENYTGPKRGRTDPFSHWM